LLGTAEAVSTEHGWSIRRRLRFARRMQVGFEAGGEFANAWERDLPDILATYPGLELLPTARMGLVPIGKGEKSGWWQFAHLMTGEKAEFGPDGELVLTDRTGIVLVLIPGGKFTMGDGTPDETDRPAHPVELWPYFLSKYEMTQGQWQRITGRNPSRYRPQTWDRDWLASGAPGSLMHPVEQVSWSDCDEWLPRMGLVLPTEAQWEHGARAGTDTAWWCGPNLDDVKGHANLSDEYAWLHGGREHQPSNPRLPDDGATMHAPVQSYTANGFGLYGSIGNVYEWCRDGYTWDSYAAHRLVDPLVPGVGDEPRVYRGGCYRSLAWVARSSVRSYFPPAMKGHALGVRPAMEIRR
jgi:formylglycine-generating enzyme required for sulfatase activity